MRFGQTAWKKWILAGTAAIVVPALFIAGFVYDKLKDMSLEEIRQRHLAVEQAPGDEASPTETPSFLQGPLEKADRLTDKDIKLQDALDVAAILLQSKLTMQEMQELFQSSDRKLSEQELRRIREVLLAKLTQDEIDTLRLIARQYGKKLDILDPNVPIGKTSSPQRDSEASSSSPVQPQAAVSDGPRNKESSSAKETAANEEKTPPSSGRESQLPASVSQIQNSTAQRKEVKAKYETEMNALKAKCEADADRLVGELSRLIQASKDGKAALDSVKTDFLQKLSAAEAGCDRAFADILRRAEHEYAQAGWDQADIAAWQRRYEAVKKETRAKAVQSLANQANHS